MKRYERNMAAISKEETEALNRKRVCVVGAGGLGGYIAEALIRVGICRLTIIDGDCFDETNLNRQLFCTEENIGKPKATEAQKRLNAINSAALITPYCGRIDNNNAEELLAGHDIVMDALDNIHSRKIVADTCRKLGIPMIHGAIGGWYGQTAVLDAKNEGVTAPFQSATDDNVDKTLGNLPFTAMCVAALQCAEAVKLLLSRGAPNKNGFMHVDLLESDFDFIKI